MLLDLDFDNIDSEIPLLAQIDRFPSDKIRNLVIPMHFIDPLLLFNWRDAVLQFGGSYDSLWKYSGDSARGDETGKRVQVDGL